MADGMSIEAAQDADLPAMRTLLVELLEAVEDTDGLDQRTALDNCRALMDDPAHYVLVARCGAAIVGLVSFGVRRTILHPGPSGLVDELVVARSHRGQGVGKRLLLAAANECRALGCCEVEVSTEMSNVAAREFYQRCGFDRESVLLEMDLD